MIRREQMFPFHQNHRAVSRIRCGNGATGMHRPLKNEIIVFRQELGFKHVHRFCVLQTAARYFSVEPM